jgi:regulator of replication initiation timing
MTDIAALLGRLEGRTMLGTSEIPQVIAALRELRKQDRISSLLIRRLSGEASDFAEKLWAAEAERDNHGKAYEGAVKNALRLQSENDALHEQLGVERGDKHAWENTAGHHKKEADALRSAVDKLRVQHSAEVALLNADKDALRAEVETHFASLQREWKLVDELRADVKKLTDSSEHWRISVLELREQLAAIKAAAEDSTEYVLALENKRLRAEIARERAARDEFQERNRNQANIIKSLREQLEAAQTMLRAASAELRKLKMTATADRIDAAIAAGVGK